MSKRKEVLGVRPAIGYARVSTKEQEKSGLGLDAQKAKLQEFVENNRFELMDIYEEVENRERCGCPG